MYKHLTPQEISEFEHKIFGIVAKLDNGSHSANQLQGVDESITELSLSFIDTLIGKRVGEIRKLPTFSNAEPLHARNKEYYNGYVTGYKSASEIALSLLSPDSPKRNEE